MSWLREQRLQRAHCYLLANDFNSITELAQDCGFGSASLFASYYKSRFGVLPSKAMITD
jgi:AraC-like DNA-binding protein